jgi:hypothetical protein
MEVAPQGFGRGVFYAVCLVLIILGNVIYFEGHIVILYTIC